MILSLLTKIARLLKSICQFQWLGHLFIFYLRGRLAAEAGLDLASALSLELRESTSR